MSWRLPHRVPVALVPLLATGVLLALAPVAASRAQTLPKSRNWLRLETPHFTIVSDAREAAARRVAVDLEELHQLLATLRPEGANTPLRTFVFAFRNDASFRNYSPRPDQNLLGVFVPGRYCNYIAVDASPRDFIDKPFYHEYLHDFAASNFPDVPLWFNEGLAEFYSTFQVDGKEALVGRLLRHHLDRLRATPLLRIDEFLRVTPASPLYNERDRASTFYAQSWIMVHYLFAEPERRQRVARYLDLLAAGREIGEAFREAFGVTFAEFEGQLYRYVQSGRFLFFRVPLHFDAATVEVTELPPAEALSLLGELVAHYQPPRFDQARVHFEAALAEVPNHPLAKSGLGLLDELDGRLDRAIESYRLAAASDQAIPSLLLGLALLERLSREATLEALTEPQKAAVEEARTALRRALELDPGLRLAQASLASTYLFAGDPAEGLGVLDEARRFFPSRPELLYAQAVLLARLERFQEAWQLASVLEHLEGQKPPQLSRPRLVRQSRLHVAQLQYKVANELLRSGQTQATLAAVDELEALARKYELNQVLRVLGPLASAAQYNLTVDKLRAITELVNSQQLDEALSGLDALLPEIADEDLEKRAQEMRDWIEKARSQRLKQ